MEKQQKRAIRNLLSVLFAGFASAVAVFAFLLYTYNPSGLYLASNTLLSPKVAEKISVDEINPKTRLKHHYVYYKIDFGYENPLTGSWKQGLIDLKTYGEFYEMVSRDKSISPVDIEKAFKEFDQNRAASLSLFLNTDGRSQVKNDPMIFQEVQFSQNGDFFRVNLHEENSTGTWAYFQHPHIYQDMVQLFEKQ